MTELRVSGAVCEAFGGLRIAAIVAEGFAGHGPWPEVDAWHAAYRAFGTNPKRERPSVDALRRRLARSGRLPRISAAVDCYNLVSVTHGVPAGAFDLDAVAGDIAVRFAAGDEGFTPLGEPDVTEHPRPGEVIYTDA